MRRLFFYLALLLASAPFGGWARGGNDSAAGPKPARTLLFSAQNLFPGEAVVIRTLPPTSFHNRKVRVQFQNYDADLVTEDSRRDSSSIVALLPIGLYGLVDVSLYLGDRVIATGSFRYGQLPVDSLLWSLKLPGAALAGATLSYEVRTNGRLSDSGDITSYQSLSYEVFSPDPDLPQFHYDDPQQIIYRIPLRNTYSPLTHYDVKVFRTKQSSHWFPKRPRRKLIDSFQLLR